MLPELEYLSQWVGQHGDLPPKVESPRLLGPLSEVCKNQIQSSGNQSIRSFSIIDAQCFLVLGCNLQPRPEDTGVGEMGEPRKLESQRE